MKTEPFQQPILRGKASQTGPPQGPVLKETGEKAGVPMPKQAKKRIHRLYKTKWQMLNPFHKPGGNDAGRIAYCVPRYLFILGAFCFAEPPAIFTFPHLSVANLYF